MEYFVWEQGGTESSKVKDLMGKAEVKQCPDERPAKPWDGS